LPKPLKPSAKSVKAPPISAAKQQRHQIVEANENKTDEVERSSKPIKTSKKPSLKPSISSVQKKKSSKHIVDDYSDESADEQFSEPLEESKKLSKRKRAEPILIPTNSGSTLVAQRTIAQSKPRIIIDDDDDDDWQNIVARVLKKPISKKVEVHEEEERPSKSKSKINTKTSNREKAKAKKVVSDTDDGDSDDEVIIQTKKKPASTTKKAGKANLDADGSLPSKRTSRTTDATVKKFVVYEDEDEDQHPIHTVNSGHGSRKVDIDSEEEESEADHRRSTFPSADIDAEDIDGFASEQPHKRPGGRAPRRAQTDVEAEAKSLKGKQKAVDNDDIASVSVNHSKTVVRGKDPKAKKAASKDSVLSRDKTLYENHTISDNDSDEPRAIVTTKRTQVKVKTAKDVSAKVTAKAKAVETTKSKVPAKKPPKEKPALTGADNDGNAMIASPRKARLDSDFDELDCFS
ncbi:hypothetical protein M422DRAFT_249148, partial [Sphaerobolus stellatus SS14]